jgi:peptide/nickel transport system ATP-binding protein
MEKTAEQQDKLLQTNKLYTNFYTYEGVVKALNGVSVSVYPGETYGLVGESGCGKSVTVRSMMRIVQAPGYIEDGRILLFLNEEDRRKGINILERSEAYMRSIRGNDISMIFQEASTALNPVLSIKDQVGESFYFHRRGEMLQKTIDQIDEELQKRPFFLAAAWKQLQRALFARELKVVRKANEKIARIDHELLLLEGKEDAQSLRKKHGMQARRENIRRFDRLCQAVKRVPFLKAYYKRLYKTIRSHSVELLKLLGVPNPENAVERYPHELSGGMQQRIVISIALACNPTMLIADEPTSNLDVTIQAQILDLIRRLKENTITSVLFITHDLGVVAEICDRVTVMYAGDTCETAAVKELFDEPLHPYTQALLESVPKEEQEGELATIPGTVPNLVSPPSGCRFHPRCPHAMRICREKKPPVTEYKPGHTVSCYLYPQEKYPLAEESKNGE